MRARCARCNHDAIQVIFLYSRFDLSLRVCRTSKQRVIRHHDIRQTARILCHRRDIHNARDIRPTMTDEHSHGWWPPRHLPRTLPLWRGQEMAGFLFVLPAALLVGGLVAYPFFYALGLSLTSRQAGVVGQFVGLRNFTDLMQGEIFRRTVRNSLLFTGVAVAFKTVLGLGLALLLRRARVGRRALRGMILLPWVVPSTLSVLGWWWLFDPLNGVVNLGLSRLGLISERIP